MITSGFSMGESRPVGYSAPSGAPEPLDEVDVYCGTCAHWVGDERGVCAMDFDDHYYGSLRGSPHFLACEHAVWWALENLRTADDEGCTSWREG